MVANRSSARGVIECLTPCRIFYVQLIIYGASAPVIFLFIRETRFSVILSSRAKRHRKLAPGLEIEIPITDGPDHDQQSAESLKKFLKSKILRPFLLLTTEPVLFFFTLLSALSYGLLFMATQSVPLVYSTLYALSEPHTGLIQASIVVGQFLGFLACACIEDPYFARASARNAKVAGGPPQLPEVRLYFAIPASFLGLAGGLFVYGWTSYANFSLWAPTTGLLLLGFGSVVVMQAVTMYITDAYAKYAASAVAALCFGENLLAATLPLASQSLYTKFGFRWASSLLAFLALALSCAPVVLVWKGRVIREKSPFMRESVAR